MLHLQIIHILIWPHTHTHTHTHTQQDSPTFPLYTDMMGKGKAKAEEGEGSPEVPQKKLTEEDLKEMYVPTAEEIPTVPKQSEDVQQMGLSTDSKVLHYNWEVVWLVRLHMLGSSLRIALLFTKLHLSHIIEKPYMYRALSCIFYLLG